MTDNSGFNRRNLLKLGGLGGLALAGGSASLMKVTFAAEGKLLPVQVITSNSTLTHALLDLLESQGYLKELGVKQTFVHLNDNSKVVPALLSGEADLCILIGFSTAMPAVEKGVDLKVVGGAGLLAMDAVYTRVPEIKTVHDLEGRTVGTGAVGALTHQLMMALLEKYGVDTKKVKFRNIGSSSAIFRAVVAGTVDAGVGGINVYGEQKKYGVHVIKEGNLWTELPLYTFQGAYTSGEAIKAKRETLVRTLAAFAKMFRFVQGPNSKDAFIKAYQKATGKNDVKAAAYQWEFIQKVRPYAVNLVLTSEQIDFMQKLNLELGVQKKKLTFDQIADMSLAHEAIKMIGGPV